MPTLSFDVDPEARAVARVRGGQYDGEILYMNDKDTRTGGGRRPASVLHRAKYMASLKGVKPAERTKVFARLEKALARNVGADDYDEGDDREKELYSRIISDRGSEKSVSLDDDGCFELIPTSDPKRREVFYIAGQSGSGKSYIAKTLAGFYHRLFPDRGVYLVSKLEKDETLDALKFIKRVNIQSFVDDYPSLEEFANCMVIFDDYDTLTGDADKVVTKIIDDLAIQGRHTCTTMLCLSHYLTNYKKTRLLLNEATHIVVYPLSTSYHALRYLLKNYVGVDEEDLKRHRKLGSRWLCYAKGFPQFMISQKDAELLHTD
jgi:hypothetical protein